MATWRMASSAHPRLYWARSRPSVAIQVVTVERENRLATSKRRGRCQSATARTTLPISTAWEAVAADMSPRPQIAAHNISTTAQLATVRPWA